MNKFCIARKSIVVSAVVMILAVAGIFAIIVNAKTNTTNVKEIVFVPGISGPAGYLDNQSEFEEIVTDLEFVFPNMTADQEIRYVNYLMGYHTEEEKLKAAMEVTSAIVLGSKAAIEMQEEMARQAAIEAQQEKSWGYEYTQEEIRMLGDLIYAEVEEYCDDEDGEKVAKATGSVVLHRIASDVFPNTLSKVIYEGQGTKAQQYASRTLNSIGNIDTPDYVYDWAEDILREGPIGPANLVFQANFPQGNETWMQYGKVYFCTADI